MHKTRSYKEHKQKKNDREMVNEYKNGQDGSK